MTKIGFKLELVIVLSLLTFGWCSRVSAQVPVFVSILPQKYFVEKIGKELVTVRVMVQPGASPHMFEPKPGQMVAIARAMVYFAVGVEFEKVWLRRLSAMNPGLKIVRTDQGIEKIPMVSHDHEEAREEAVAAVKHDSASPDPHIWLAPSLVKQQSTAILQSLQLVDPLHGDRYQANFDRFMEELERLDEELKNTFQNCEHLQFIVFHPSWGYFAREYKLEQIPIEFEGKDPKPARLMAVINFAKSQRIKVVFAQPQLATRSAKLIAREINGQVILIDPLAEDWGSNMRLVAEKFREALQSGSR